MARSIDDIYTTIIFLSERIANMSPDDPARARLEREREEVRSRAAAIASKGRHPKSVELQVEAIKQRLEEIDALLIKEGYMERHIGKAVQDPSAYSTNINRLLTQRHAEEVRSLTEQLERLRPSDNSQGDDPHRTR